jgi:glycosyltransferase involved in cell wall biosynthesis
MISIVIIGKNEAKNLPKLYCSLKNIEVDHEIIYVDSASSDNSVELSKKECNQVIEIEDSPQLCAAAGRNIGTNYAKNNWILYLDGDMELESEFIGFLNSKEFLTFDKNIAGFIGYYDYIYSDGTNDPNRLLQPKDKITDHFGGAVMLQKDVVLDAGNWNPSVVANEEIDLYIRIQSLAYSVFGLDKKFVKHIAKKESNIKTLISLFIPQNRRFYGFGQVLVSQYKSKTLMKFISKRLYPFIYLLLLLLCTVNIGFLFVLIVLFVYISFKKRWYYNLIYISEIIRGVAGVILYKEYIPKVKGYYEIS